MSSANESFRKLDLTLRQVATALQKAFEDTLMKGRTAFQEGKDTDANPYPEESRLHGLWLCGYFGVKTNQEIFREGK